MERDNIKLALRDLLRAKWDASNTILDKAPLIHTGWFDKAKEEPQITVTTKEESSEIFSGIAPNGIVKDYDGSVQINTWVEEDLTKGYRKQLSDELEAEVKRIIHENYATLEGYMYISLITNDERNNLERNPVLYRYNLMVGYRYRDIL